MEVKLKVLFAAILATYSLQTSATCIVTTPLLGPAPDCFKTKIFYAPRAYINAFYQSKSQSYEQVDGWMPLRQSDNAIIFGDARFLYRQGNNFEGNIGLGSRYINSDNLLIGGYAYYDRRHLGIGNTFQQFTLGAEVKSLLWTLRGNGYLPFGARVQGNNSIQTSALTQSGTAGILNIRFNNGVVVAQGGFDGEIGVSNPTALPGLTIYGGYYCFPSSNGMSTMQGPMARVDYNIADNPRVIRFKDFDSLELEGSIRHDQVSGTVFLAGVRFGLNFGGTPRYELSPMQRHLVDFVQRDIDIVVQDDAKNLENIAKNANGTPVKVGIATDAASLQQAIDNQVDVIGVKGSINNLNTVELADNQLISGFNYEFQPSRYIQVGQNGALSSNPDTTLMLVGKNNTVRELSLTSNNLTVLRPVIANDGFSSVGNLTIYKNQTNGIIAAQVQDGSTDSVISISENTINMNLIGVAPIDNIAAIFVSNIGSTITVPKVYSNHVNLSSDIAGLGNFAGISLQNNSSLSQTGILNIDQVSSNVINVSSTTATGVAGISIDDFPTARPSGGPLNINHIDSNSITVSSSSLNVGIFVNNGTNTTTSINNMYQNQITSLTPSSFGMVFSNQAGGLMNISNVTYNNYQNNTVPTLSVAMLFEQDNNATTYVNGIYNNNLASLSDPTITPPMNSAFSLVAINNAAGDKLKINTNDPNGLSFQEANDFYKINYINFGGGLFLLDGSVVPNGIS